jgi:hypothetical protein
MDHEDDQQRPDGESEGSAYEAPEAEEVDSTGGPALTSAAATGPD